MSKEADPVLAAGAVVWREAAGGTEIALVHRPRYDDWSLPKGKLDGDERLEAAAVREVAEETGQAGRLGAPLGTVRYQVHSGGGLRDKVVHFWAMRATGGSFVASREVDELEWLDPEAARRRLSYDRDRAVLDRFRALDPAER